jgi:hypothetical protein
MAPAALTGRPAPAPGPPQPGWAEESCCYVTLEQSLLPHNLPPFLRGAFKGFARHQVRTQP